MAELATVPQKAALTQVLGSCIQGTNAVSPAEAYVPDARAAVMHQATTANAAGGAFKWVNDIVSPSMFASADNTLLFAVPPLASMFNPTGDYALLGMTNSFSFTIGTSYYSYKELRGEHTIIVPQKSALGNINISRLLGGYANIYAAITGAKCWAWDNQARVNKQLFGLMAVYLTTNRTSTIGALYFERCFINGVSSGAQANEFTMFENVSMVFDRVIDNLANANIGAATQKAGTFSTEGGDSSYYTEAGGLNQEASGSTTGTTPGTVSAPTRWDTEGKTPN